MPATPWRLTVCGARQEGLMDRTLWSYEEGPRRRLRLTALRVPEPPCWARAPPRLCSELLPVLFLLDECLPAQKPLLPVLPLTPACSLLPRLSRWPVLGSAGGAWPRQAHSPVGAGPSGPWVPSAVGHLETQLHEGPRVPVSHHTQVAAAMEGSRVEVCEESEPQGLGLLSA